MKKTGQLIFAKGYAYVEDINLNHDLILKELKDLKYRLADNYPVYKTYISDPMNILKTIPSGKKLLKEVSKHVQDSIDNFFEFNIKHKIINGWATYSPPNTTSAFHVHNNFWLSACYYPHGTIKDNFYINFSSNYLDTSFEPPVKKYNPLNSQLWSQTVKKGDLIIFPSNLRHRIGYNHTNKNRYSIAFNILPKGSLGSSDGVLKY